MRIKIVHKTTYKYSDKVFLEPHHLYFFPCSREHISLKRFEISLNPEVAGLSSRLDPENNIYYQSWFNEPTDRLAIDVNMEIEASSFNPFNFLLEQREARQPVLQIYLDDVEINSDIERWMASIFEGHDHISKITNLVSNIHDQWDHTVRYEEDLHTPIQCFDFKKGSCRDLTWMMIHMLRSKGYPARFVSGYAYNDELGEGHELHAWVETWIEGAGWIGFDPSAGLLVTNSYIPVVTSYDPKYTFPVQGSYRGKANSKLDFEISIEAIE